MKIFSTITEKRALCPLLVPVGPVCVHTQTAGASHIALLGVGLIASAALTLPGVALTSWEQ